ncbi:MAG TPA: hypothetical protein VFQ61_32125 [Polyangiaceae bacterium]|nr:hypothetical protein [Polyangiaceae bacterium]
MARSLRSLGLTGHVAASVGWLGAVMCFDVLAFIGLYGSDPQLTRSSLLLMRPIVEYLIVPLCLAATITGVVQSMITKWGLFEHYWVVVKLVLTIVATLALWLHLSPIRDVSAAAKLAPALPSSLSATRLQVSVDATLATITLLVLTGLGVYKPRGVTPYGWRKHNLRWAHSKS